MKNALFLSVILFVSSPFPAGAASRRPPQSQLAEDTLAVLATPSVEKLKDRYRIQLVVPEVLPYSLIERNEKRIWIRFVRAASDGSQILEGDSVVKEMRIVQRRHSVDFVLKLGDDAVSNDLYFEEPFPSENLAHEGKRKLVVDIFTSNKLPKESKPLVIAPSKKKSHSHTVARRPAERPVPVIGPAPVPTTNTPVLSPAPSKGNAKIVVVDAGHGGLDSGAMGARGTNEKDVNLEMAKALAKLLQKEKNIHVLMTRTDDKFIPLNERTAIANAANADLFISIHCNASLSPKHTGLEVYYLSPEATDKAAESVARLENSVVHLEEEKGVRQNSKLTQLLASMAVYNFINESSKFAALICRNLKNKFGLDQTSVKEADFYVLRGAQMPSVLVELDYLSNPVSEIKLRSSRYRSQLAKGVVEAVKAYEKQVNQEHGAVAAQYKKVVTKRQQ
jgi:N-acetylmuramoyl-L-alanine amidase